MLVNRCWRADMARILKIMKGITDIPIEYFFQMGDTSSRRREYILTKMPIDQCVRTHFLLE